MEAQSNASEAALDQARRKRSRLVQTIDPAFPGVRGLRDLWQGWRDYRELWFTVGLFDIRKRYRRSVLGPFWITISLGAFIHGLGFIYSPLVGGGTASFLPFVTFGFIAWQFISQLVLDGCNVFIANGPTLLVVPGIILVGVNGVSIGMLLGTLCARFRDIPPIVQTITQNSDRGGLAALSADGAACA